VPSATAQVSEYRDLWHRQSAESECDEKGFEPNDRLKPPCVLTLAVKSDLVNRAESFPRGYNRPMGPSSTPNNLPAAVPLFPLPNVVLFPRAVLPLHVFEERYKQMTADALEGPKLIAMALLLPGWEKNYYGKPALHPAVCVGEILTHEELPDGKYNFLLRGVMRATIVRETGDLPYRLAELRPLPDVVPSPDLDAEGEALAALLARAEMGRVPGIEQFRQLAGGLLPVQDVADLLAFHVLDDVATKQSLLAETDVRARVRRVIDNLETICASLPMPRPRIPRNPSMN